ncbi:MAG: hypothetical protein E6R08_05115 [Nevskiaceae bacterium]|nr:MAG: hypothetical protein E6R08_05115 [Nevskiaceae bacterium]
MSLNPFARPTLRAVQSSLKALAKIERPQGDNHHLSINHPDILGGLSSRDGQLAETAASLLFDYVRDANGDADRRSINALTRHGHRASLAPDQDDRCRMVGYVQVEEWRVNVSDPWRGDGIQDD